MTVPPGQLVSLGDDIDRSDAAALIGRLQDMLADRFRVHHTTLQVERPACEQAADGCTIVGRPPHDGPSGAAGHAH